MAFEGLEKNLILLRSQSQISAEDLIDSMNRLLSDAEVFNRERGIPEFKAQKIERYSLDLQDLLIMLNHIFSLHRDELEALDDEYLNKILNDSKKVQEDIEGKTSTLKKLDTERAEREQQNKRIEELQDQIKHLEDKLASFRDISEDELAQKKSDLESQIKKRETINEEVTTLESQISGESKVAGALLQQLKNLENEKQRLEEEEKSSRAAIEDYQGWLEEHAKTYEKFCSQFSEATNAFTAIYNAWNSLKNRRELPDLMDASDYSKLFDAKVTSFSELDKWFEQTAAHINVSLETYRSMYNSVMSRLPK